VSVQRRVYVFLAVGLVAASQSGNLVRLGHADPVAITAWRLLLASLMLIPMAGRDLALLARLGRRDTALLFAAGAALAAHLISWIAAVQHTTVASAATFFAINPVITATSSFLIFKERVSPRLAGSIALGVLGVALLGWGDLSLAREHLVGDGLALLCSVLFTAYFLVGKRLRQRLPTAAYVAAIYGVASAFAFAALLALGLPFVDYDGQTWLCFALMAVGPTVIGHTSMNHALAHLRAGWISTATLSEPLLAGFVAFFAWGEGVTWLGAAGYALICLSVAALALERQPQEAGRPPEPASAS
jgi:drug/metabolite transporter (DMT)-like permease